MHGRQKTLGKGCHTRKPLRGVFTRTQNGKNNRVGWSEGGEIEGQAYVPEHSHPYRLVLLGAPGVGKGTQAEMLSARLGLYHLSTGDIFRAAKTLSEDERSPAMTRALEYMRKGELVPDEIVLDLIRERGRQLQRGGGFALDGFPRTVAQAEALEHALATHGFQLDAVLSYELSLDQIISRLSGRRTCPNCKAVYHVTMKPPGMEGICDLCGSALYQREDDRPEAVRVRMEVYQKSTAPLDEFYRLRNLLVPVSAEGTPEEIYARTMVALEKIRKSIQPQVKH